MKKVISLLILLLSISTFCFSQTKQLDLGDKVPYFTLPNQDGKPFSMKDSIGTKLLVIFFYPKDEDILCAKELNVFNDSINTFNNAGALVVGISENSIDKLQKFHKEHNLKYELLCDSTGAVLNSFGVKEKFFSDRITFISNIAGEIVFKGASLGRGKKHAQEALAYLHDLKKQ